VKEKTEPSLTPFLISPGFPHERAVSKQEIEQKEGGRESR